ncbi:alpha-ketoglutarate-dependent dioxygenase AlkB [Bizionia argentinensis JUB59]|uniref:Alpha-ketoglutarate-dependent dioxygenase AlkB n=1 Tax=Bizionia argentinensis JUB59 TaxID=1046627 RepID=G2EG26_9FLAO|nr:alpha-ketoglutarate-dependent dioxygenase AlkB [Bizionia argentinensis]EGV42610.1 alpha-ketoglutarate-dependent dioxygenase AlkB [Bizionia argentinensis JUB59]
MDLFSSDKTEFHLPQAELIYIPHFYNPLEANKLFKKLKETCVWQQDTITIFGKTHLQPRLTALYANNEKSYSCSNITMLPKKFTPDLQEMKVAIEKVAHTDFTSVLLNRYRSGSDSNGWHADNEKELGKKPIIASLSFGAPRYFHFKHRTLKNEKHKLLLESGSLLIMAGQMQEYWLHQIPKTKKEIGERINLTFRKII